MSSLRRRVSEAWQGEPVKDVRVVPCSNVDGVWVEVWPPFEWKPGTGIEMTPTLARTLAEHLTSAADRADAWKEGSY